MAIVSLSKIFFKRSGGKSPRSTISSLMPLIVIVFMPPSISCVALAGQGGVVFIERDPKKEKHGRNRGGETDQEKIGVAPFFDKKAAKTPEQGGAKAHQRGADG